MGDNEEGVRRREFKIIPRQVHSEPDCRLRDFCVLSTFNETRPQEGRPILLIPGTLLQLREKERDEEEEEEEEE
jgi:hypothetical protein